MLYPAELWAHIVTSVIARSTAERVTAGQSSRATGRPVKKRAAPNFRNGRGTVAVPSARVSSTQRTPRHRVDGRGLLMVGVAGFEPATPCSQSRLGHFMLFDGSSV